MIINKKIGQSVSVLISFIVSVGLIAQANAVDSDGDGLSDYLEGSLGTNASIADSDGDGIDDGVEVDFRYLLSTATINSNGVRITIPTFFRLDPLNPNDAGSAYVIGDDDNDGLSNLTEFEKGSNYLIEDTDYDGIPDDWEVANGLNPAVSDLDVDGDGDGLNNVLEYQLGTSLSDADTDGDGLLDGFEYSFRLTYNSKVVFYSSIQMITADTFTLNPLDPNDGMADEDGDGLSNAQEILNGLDLLDTNDALQDSDNDGLSNLAEILNGLNYLDAEDVSQDFDNDGMSNLVEILNGLDPHNASDALEDIDNDGLSNFDELQFGTLINVADSDGDGMNDGAEILNGYDPLASSSVASDLDEYLAAQDPCVSGCFDVNPEISDGHAGAIVPGGAMQFPGQPTNHSDVVGVMKGRFKVDQNGAANYTIPVDLPPGINGLQPDLSFNYSSQKGNGDMGVGWSLTGGSAIARCRSNLERDGVVKGIDFDGTDNLCLDGKKLVLVSGVQGASNSEYLVQLGGLEKIVAIGNQGNGPAGFQIFHSNGLVSYYGNNDGGSDALHWQASGPGNVYAWYLNRRVDPFGNEINYDYLNWSTGGALILSTISYSDYTVRLGWQSVRFDHRFGAIAQDTLKLTNYLLEELSWEIGGNEIGSYSIDYEFLGGKSVVAGITQCSDGQCLNPTLFGLEGGQQNLGAEDTSFTSQLGDVFFSRKADTSDDLYDMGVRIADINGDGKDDLIQMYLPEGALFGPRRVYLSNGSEFVLDDEYTASIESEGLYFSSHYNFMGTHVIDVNGDGLVDLLQSYRAKYGQHYLGELVTRVLLNDGTKFEESDSYSDSLTNDVGIEFTTISVNKGYRFADITGDGLIDIVGLPSIMEESDWGQGNSNRVWINDGSGFKLDEGYSSSLPISHFFEARSGSDRGTRIADINGDGLADIITLNDIPPYDFEWFAYYRSDPLTIYSDPFMEFPFRGVYLNTGASFELNTEFISNLPEDLVFTFVGGYDPDGPLHEGPSFSHSVGSRSMGVKLADINGDGYVDLIQMFEPKSGEPVLKRVYLNNGITFNFDEDYSNSINHPDFDDTNFAIYESDEFVGGKDNGTRLADLNGDGLVDIIQLYLPENSWISQTKVFLNTGVGFYYDSQFSSVYSNNALFTDAESRDMGTRLGDFNGDGIADIIQLYQPAENHYLGEPQKKVFITEKISLNVNKITRSEMVGGDIDIHYETLSESESYASLQVTSYPEVAYQGPLQVVTSYEKDNGVGSVDSTSYSYEDMKLHIGGAGPLGFRKIIKTDPLGFISTAVYSQDWQNKTVGMVERQWRIAPYSTTVLISEVNELNLEATAHLGGDVYFPHVLNKTAVKRDLNGAFISSKSNGYRYHSWGHQLLSDFTCIHSADPTYGVSSEVLTSTLPCDFVSPTEDFKEAHLYAYYDESFLPGLPRKLKTKATWSEVPHALPYPMEIAAPRTTEYDYHWDLGGALKSEIIEPNDASLQQRTDYTYNASGLRDTVSVSGYDMSDDVTQFNYNSNGTLASRVAGYGNQNLATQYFYADSRFPWLVTGTRDTNTLEGYSSQVQYDSFGRPEITIDKLGVTQTVIKSWCADTWACVDSDGYSYIETIVTPGDSFRHVVFDTLGREKYLTALNYNTEVPAATLQTTVYNAQGRKQFVSVPYYFDEIGTYVFSGMSYQYDDLGRVIGTTDQDNYHTSTEFNARTVTRTNRLGYVSSEVFNALGQTISVTDADQHTSSYLYGPLGNLVQVTDWDSNPINIGYNVRGFKTDMLDPDRGEIKYSYDGAGKIRTLTDNKGQVSETHYDNLGRVTTQIDDRDGNAVTNSWTYFTSGQHSGLIENISGNGLTESYRYDAFSRLNETTTTVDLTPTTTASYTSSRSYDALGRISFLNYPGNSLRLKYEYQAETGILQRVRNDETGLMYWEASHQNAAGVIEGFTLGGEINVSVNHRPGTGLVDSLYAINSMGQGLVQQSYDYDAGGNLIDRYDTANDVHDHYTYDGLNRLKSNEANTLGGTLMSVQAVVYDAIGNIYNKSDVESGSAYQYGGAAGCSNANQTCVHAVTEVGSKSFVYDANGNMTSGWGREIQYTAFDKPSSIVKNDSTTTAFSYGPAHSRYKRVDSGGASPSTTYYIQGLMEVVTGSTTKTKLFVEDVAVVTLESGQNDKTRYLLKDQLGSVIAIANEIGAVEESYNYDAWGKRRYVDGDFMDESAFIGFTSLMITNQGYTGHEHLDEAGLIHMNGRVYDPLLARFLSADPIIQAPMNMQSLNRYSYVWNNPLSFTDPSGFSTQAYNDYSSGNGFAENDQDYIPPIEFQTSNVSISINYSDGENDFSFGSSGINTYNPGGYVPADLVTGSGTDNLNLDYNLVRTGVNIDLPCVRLSATCSAVTPEEAPDGTILDGVETSWNIFLYIAEPFGGVGRTAIGLGRGVGWALTSSFGREVAKSVEKIGWKSLSKERQNAVNKFMTQYDKGAPGAKKLLEDIQKNGVPKGLDKQAFQSYADQIKNVGGNKAATKAAEVFQTRLQVLDKILGGS